MAVRPASYPTWTDGNSFKVTQPDGATALQGFTAGEPPPFQYVNWLFWVIGSWIAYLDQLTNTNFNGALIRLINGGNWSFSASSGALAWSSAFNLAIPSCPDASNQAAAGSVTLPDGYIAYTTANLPSQSQGSTDPTNFPDEIVNMNFTGNISVGMNVTGPGIAGGTTVLGVAPNSVLLSQNTTSVNSNQNYTFSNSSALTVQTALESTFVPSPSTILLARRAGNFVYLGINCAQMVLRDGEFKPLIGTGYEVVYQLPAGQNLTVGQLVYVSPGSSDGGRTAGAAYPLDVSAANQAVRGTYAGVVITAVSTGGTATLLYSGLFDELGTLTAGVVYYADPATPGGVTSTQPSGSGQKIVPVGYATSTTVMLFSGVSLGVNVVQFPLFNDSILGVGNGTQTVFTLPFTPYSNSAVMIFAGGTKVAPGSGPGQVQVSGTTVTFGTAPPIGAQVEGFEVLASQSYVRMFNEIAHDTGDHQTFSLTNAPLSLGSILAFVGGVKYPNTSFIVVLGSTPQIKFNSPLSIGQLPDVTYAY